jgi:hypothetical protein
MRRKANKRWAICGLLAGLLMVTRWAAPTHALYCEGTWSGCSIVYHCDDGSIFYDDSWCYPDPNCGPDRPGCSPSHKCYTTPGGSLICP